MKLITFFHPQTDSEAECTIPTHEDILRACIIDFKKKWVKHFPLMEFAYYKSFHSSIYMDLYEALYGRRCRSSIGWFVVGGTSFLHLNLIYNTLEKVRIIRNRLRTVDIRQKSYIDHSIRDL